MTLSPSAESPRRLALPDNLLSWLDAAELVAIISEASSATSWPGRADERRPDLEALLVVVTSFYAIGLYSSQDIERSLAREEDPGLLVDIPSADWKTIYWFRRRHRGAVRQCLARVFAEAWRRHQHRVVLDDPAHDSFAGTSLWLSDLPSQGFFEVAADERLQRAMMADSVALDD